MKRRWKIGIALAVVGLAAFLVWAILKPATPPLIVRSQGYLTNKASEVIGSFESHEEVTWATFSVTNKTSRAMDVCILFQHSTHAKGPLMPVMWLDATNHGAHLYTPCLKLDVGEGALAAVYARPSVRSVQIQLLTFSSSGKGNLWSFLTDWIPPSKGQYTIEVTSEPR